MSYKLSGSLGLYLLKVLKLFVIVSHERSRHSRLSPSQLALSIKRRSSSRHALTEFGKALDP